MASPGRKTIKTAGDESSVKVAVRVRPFIKEEADRKDECKLILSAPSKQSLEIAEPGLEHRVQSFVFDRVYWSHNKDHNLFATQETLYSELGNDMIQHALSGYNTCIFAYGQTGSGKSYSVLGDSSESGRGLLPRVVQGLFEHFGGVPETHKWSCIVSFMEIYNEQIRDLLVDHKAGAPAAEPLKVQNHPVLGAVVQGLTDISVKTKDEVMKRIDQGMLHRVVGATAMNNNSSRSHCIFTFKTSITDDEGVQIVSQTHLVDLAGSERASRTQAQGSRLQEGAAINKSLSVLTRVIQALADNASKPKAKIKAQPPFRDSKLTHILKESLCGNSKTVMMAALSPSGADFEETMSTLRFAQSVKKVQLTASANQLKAECEQALEAQLRDEVATLRKRLIQERFVRTIAFSKSAKEQEELMKEHGINMDEVKSGGMRLTVPGHAADYDVSPCASEANSPRGSTRGISFQPDDGDACVLATFDGGDPPVSLVVRNAGSGSPEELERLRGELAKAQGMSAEARSAFALGRASSAVAKLRPVLAVDPEEPLAPHLCLSFQPTTSVGKPGPPGAFFTPKEVQEMLEWVGELDEEQKKATAPLALWQEAASNVRSRGRRRTRFSTRGSVASVARMSSEQEGQAERRKMRRHHTAEVTQLQHDLEEAHRQILVKEQQLKAGESKQASGEMGPSKSSPEVQKLEALLAKASAAGQALVQTNQELVDDKERLMEEIDNLKDEVRTLQEENSCKDTEIEELEQKLKMEGVDRRKSEHDVREMELFEDHQELQEQLEEMSRQKRALEKQLTMMTVGARVGNLDSSGGTDDDDKAQVIEELKALKEKLESVERALAVAQHEFDDAVEENSSLQKQIHDLEEKHANWSANGINELEALQGHCDKLFAHAKELEGELEASRTENHRLLEKLELAGVKKPVDKKEYDASDLIFDKDGNVIGRRRRSGEDTFGKELAGKGLDEDEGESPLCRMEREYNFLKQGSRARLQTGLDDDDDDGDGVKKVRSRDYKSARSLDRLKSGLDMSEALARVEADRQRIKELEQERAQLSGDLERLRGFEAKVKELEEQLGEKAEKMTSMEIALEMAKHGSHGPRDDASDGEELEFRCKELEQDLEQQAEKMADMAAEFDSCRERNAQLEALVGKGDIAEQLARSAAELAAASAEAAERQERLSGLEQAEAALAERAEQEREAAKSQEAASAAALVALEGELRSELAQQLEQLELARAAGARAEAGDSELRSQLQAAEARASATEQAEVEVREELRAQRSEHEEAVKALAAHEAKLVGQALALQQAQEAAKSREAEGSAKLQDAQAKEKELLAELAAAAATAKEAETRAEALQKGEAALRAEHEEALKAVSAHEAKLVGQALALQQASEAAEREAAGGSKLKEELAQLATFEAAAKEAEARAEALLKGEEAARAEHEEAAKASAAHEAKLVGQALALQQAQEAAKASEAERVSRLQEAEAKEKELTAELATLAAAAKAADERAEALQQAHAQGEGEVREELAKQLALVSKLETSEATLEAAAKEAAARAEALLKGEEAARAEHEEAAKASAAHEAKLVGQALALQQAQEAAKASEAERVSRLQEAEAKDKELTAELATLAAAAKAADERAEALQQAQAQGEGEVRGELAKQLALVSKLEGSEAALSDKVSELEASLKAEHESLAAAAKAREEELAAKAKDSSTAASSLEELTAKYAAMEASAEASQQALRAELALEQEAHARDAQDTKQKLAHMGIAADAGLKHHQEEYKCAVERYSSELNAMKAHAEEQDEALASLAAREQALALQVGELDEKKKLLAEQVARNDNLEALIHELQKRLEEEEARREALLE